jgi:two-component system phosphate regulon sensor histidine kinase PhoR
MKRSIFIKLFIGFFLLICFLSVSVILVTSSTFRTLYTDVLTHAIERASAPLAASVKKHLRTAESRSTAVARIESEFSRDGWHTDGWTIDGWTIDGWTIQVIDREGEVLASSSDTAGISGDHPEIGTALTGVVGRRLLWNDARQGYTLSVALPIMDQDSVLGVFLVEGPAIGFESLQGKIRSRIHVIAIIIILCSLCGLLLFMTRLIKPVKVLNETAKQVAAGDFDRQVYMKKSSILRELADNYNRMTQRVRYSLEDLTSQKEQLDAIIGSMQPGLMLLDSEGRITLFNESIERIIESDQIRDRFYWEVIREPHLWDIIQRVQESGKNARNEVQMGNNFYQVTTAFLPKVGEVVMVFHDITEMKHLEMIKRDFVVNVSHELRTPLTAIKGYAETITGVNEENGQFLDIIKRHTDRLIKIVEDLLILSELEEAPLIHEDENVPLGDIAEHVIRMFENRIHEKGLDIRLSIGADVPSIRGDTFKFEQIFINLVDNAIKYTENGAITIRLSLRDSSVVLEVGDTGIGISEQQVSRIFERFYTVDKSRSRRMGGTGLGLSIVKHIVNLHGGTINVTSTLGKGTTFTIIIPALPP